MKRCVHWNWIYIWVLRIVPEHYLICSCKSIRKKVCCHGIWTCDLSVTEKNLGFTSGLCSLWELFLLVLFFHLFCFVFFFSVCHYLTNYCSNVECFSPECRKVIAHLASLLDWLKKLAPIFYPIRSKIKLTETRSRTFSRPFRQLHVINSSFYWFLVLSMYLGLPRVISLVLVLRHSIETALLFSLEESDEEPELVC